MNLRKFFRVRIRLLSLLLIAFGLAVSAQAQTRIMPLGDSNTRGKSQANYRSYLRNLLINQAQFPMNYVGSGVGVGGAHGPGGDSNVAYTNAEIAALGNDLEHEGWGGYTIDGLRAGANGWISSANPEIILLMVGTNDFNYGIGEGAIERLDLLIGQILEQRPGVTLVVGSIPPGKGEFTKWNRTVNAYNSQIPVLVNDYAAEGFDVYFANINPALNPETDLIDNLHPTAGGYQKIAGAWYEVLSQLADGNSQPQVTFTVNGPQNEGHFLEGATLTIAAQAFDADGTVTNVKFFANGNLIGQASSDPFILTWPQVARGAYQITAVAYDDKGFPAYSYPLNIRVGEPLPRAVVVVGGGGLLDGDYKIADTLATLGLEAVFYADAEVAGGVGEAELIVISSTVSSASVGTYFKNSSIPVITCEPFLFDDMGLTGGVRGTDFELTSNQTQIQITNPLHPLAAGLGAGVIQAASSGAGFFSWGRPAGGVFSVAHLPGFPDRSAIFAVERDGMLFGGQQAAERRVGLFLGDYTASNFTAAGQSLLNSAIVWALDGAVGGPPTNPGVNLVPKVGVEGGDQFFESGLPATTTLHAWVLDDGLPLGNALVVNWTSANPNVQFSDPASPTTGVTFPTYGSFVLTITVSDGELSASKDVTVTAVDPNGPPAGLAYSENPAVYALGETATPNTPTSLGSAVTDYSISPGLPAGLAIDPLTGIINGTPTAGSEPVTYTVTATNGLGSTTTELELSVQMPPLEVLLVVGKLALNSGDSAIRNWFASRNFVITLSTLADVQEADAVGKDLIFITATGTSGSLGERLRDVEVPVIVSEPYLYGAMGMTSGVSNVTMGNSEGETQVEINEPSHPLAAGLDGTIDVVSSGTGFFGWGIPTSDAISVATLGSNAFRSALFGYDTGTSLVNGSPSPHRRLGMFLGDLTATNFNANGWQLFSAGVQWALVGGGFGPDGPPRQLTYSKSSAVYELGVEIVPNVPSLRGGTADSFSITPELPAGLVFDNLTGIISGTPTESRFTTIYQVTAYSEAGSTNRSISISVPGPPLGNVLLVVGNLTLNTGDRAIHDWFEAAGYVVTLRSFSAVHSSDAVGKNLVMITATGASNQIGGRLRDVVAPTIVCESYIFDDMGLTTIGDGVALGSTYSESRIGISNPDSPLAAGLSGIVDVVVTGDGYFTWGVPGGDGITIATLGSNPLNSAIFAYETGTLLASGQVAPQRRLGMFLGDLTAANFTAAGWQIFSACVNWAIQGTAYPEDGPPAELGYSVNPAEYELGAAITPNVPFSQGGPVDSYSINPPLPAGLAFDTVTGIISGTPEEIRFTSLHEVTAVNEVGSAKTTLVLSVSGPPLGDVLLVVGSLTLNSGDAAIRDWFETAGYVVTVQTFADVQVADTIGMDLVMISATGVSSQIGGRLTDVPVPVIVCESFIFDDMGLTLAGDGVRLGSVNSQSQIQIVRPEHPLAAGLSGLATVVSNNAGYFTWGTVAGDGLSIATLPSIASRSTIFAYESGSLLASGQTAAHRRLGLFLGDFTAASFNSTGSRMFAASVQWAINGTGFDVEGPPIQLTYSTSPAVYNLNVPIIPNTPSSLGGAVEGYSITPALPAGLQFDPVTGVISGTPTEFGSATTFQVTAFNEAGFTSTTLNLAISGGALPKALLVVGSLTLNTGDIAIRDWFVSSGYSVTLRTLTAVQAADAVGQDLVMITSTGSSNQIGSRLSDVAVPVIVCEPYIYGNMGMTLQGIDVDMGISLSQARLDLIAPGHPLAAGFSGLTTVVTSGAGFFPWGLPGSEAVKIATLDGDPSRSAMFAYESGSLLASGLPAPNRRIGLFLGDLTAANFTAEGSQLFAAAVQWAYDGRTFDENGAPARLRYSSNRAVYPPGVPITPNVPSTLGGPVAGYAISPALPAGLILDPVTGIISGTPTEIRVETAYQVTAYNQSGVTTATLTLGVPGPKEVLLVVGSLTLHNGDVALRNWFQAAGYLVTLRTFSAVQPADATGKDLVLISATGSSSQIGGRLKDVAVPIIVCESAIHPDMGMTAPGAGVNMGNMTAQSQIRINSPGHQLAAGLTGLTTVISGASQVFNWGVPAGDAVNVATLASDSSRSTVFAYEAGSLLASGQAAPHRRLGLFLGDLTPSRLNTAGLQVLAAAVHWAVNGLAENSLPSELSYSSDPAVYELDVAITPNVPSSNGGSPQSYSIAPLLPAGLVLNPSTGVISGTPTVVRKATRYQVTGSNAAGSSSVTLTFSVEGPGEVLLVVGNLNLNAGDKAVRDWFVANGYLVTLRTLAEVQTADTTGNDLVVITSTGTSAQIGSRLRDVAVPVIVCEPYIFGLMAMTLPGDNVQMGISTGESQLDVIGTAHPLAAGLSGLTPVVSSNAGFLSWGVPGSGAVKIATLAADPSRSPLFAYEIGNPLVSGQPAPSRRVGLFLGDLTAANLNVQGLQLFAAAVQWALEMPVFDENGPPVLLNYTTNPAVYEVDVPITPNVPSSLGGAVASYSVMPPLPKGLVLNSTTGVISGNPKTGKPPATYLVTATNAAGSTTRGLEISVQGPPPGDVLLVVGSLSLNAGDTAIHNWFLAGGYNVTLSTLAAVQAADATDKVLVFITSTGTSAQIGSRLRNVAVPVIVCEPYIFGNMGMTLPGDNVQMGNSPGETQLNLIASEHPLTAGLSGLTTVVNNNAGFFAWGVPGGDAVNIASHASNSLRSGLFAYESGSQMATVGEFAPHRRLGMFMGDLTAANFTTEGWWIFAAGVEWAIQGIVIDEEEEEPPLNPPVGLSYTTNTAVYELNTAITANVPSSQGGSVDGYTITPALPAGLAFDPVTGIISGTPTEIRAAASYEVTASNVDGSTSTTLTLSVAGPPEVLLVVGSLSLNAGDTALRNWFQSAGYVVTLRTYSAVQVADATGKGLVMISATGTSSQIGSRLRDVAVPVIVCESFIFDDMGLTIAGDDVQLGNLASQSQVQIVSPGHPVAAGLSGITSVVSGSQTFTWGVPGANAVNIAALASNPNRSTLFAYEAGSQLASGQVAAHRRMGMFLHDLTPGNLSTEGLQLLAASVQWARGIP